MAKTTIASLSDALAARLTKGALPGELQGFGKAEQKEHQGDRQNGAPEPAA